MLLRPDVAVIARSYGNRCAITGDKVRPVASGGIHRPDNGMQLRSDMHTLYGRGYIGIDPHLRLNLSPQLREEFGNGDALYARAATEIASPARSSDQPNRELLEWHLNTVFRRAA